MSNVIDSWSSAYDCIISTNEQRALPWHKRDSDAQMIAEKVMQDVLDTALRKTDDYKQYLARERSRRAEDWSA